MKKLVVFLVIISTAFASYAQNSKVRSKEGKTDTRYEKKYTCPMHPDVVSNKPGKCAKCGMELVEKKIYTCPMHPDVLSDKPGACPKCGMDLVVKKATSKKSKTKKT